LHLRLLLLRFLPHRLHHLLPRPLRQFHREVVEEEADLEMTIPDHPVLQVLLTMGAEILRT
jgi:hypothetical protein